MSLDQIQIDPNEELPEAVESDLSDTEADLSFGTPSSSDPGEDSGPPMSLLLQEGSRCRQHGGYRTLPEARSLQGLSDKRVDELMALWQRLPEPDRRRVVYPPRHQERQPKGRFKTAKGKTTSCPGKESLQRCLLGLNSGPATWPSASRLVEAICSQLCRLHPAVRRDHEDSVVLHPHGLHGH
ncbi:hypothetical protein KUCAC02_009637 [Chaenocephalus aceratus]|nr:hypothetical protein KUCAC02_009637 [Chaenocephalus aceratus]